MSTQGLDLLVSSFYWSHPKMCNRWFYISDLSAPIKTCG